MELIDYFRILRKRRLFIIVGTMGLVFLAVIVSSLLPRVYASSVDLLVTGPTTQVEFTAKDEPRIDTELQPNVSIDTYRDLLYNHYLADKVVEKLGYKKNPESIATQALMDQVSVRAVPKTSLLRLTVEDTDAKRAHDLAEVWAELFVEQNRELNQRELKVIGSIVEDKLAETTRELREAEEELKRFQERELIGQLKMQIDNRIKQIVHLEARLKKLRVEKEKTQAKLKQSMALLKSVGPDSTDRPSGTAPEPLQFLQPVRPESPSETAPSTTPLILGSVKNPESLVALALRERVVDSQVELSTIEAEEKQSSKSVEELRQELVVLKKQVAAEELEQRRLQRALASIQTTYDVLVKKAEEVKVARATRPGTVKIAVPAFVPLRPVRPRPVLNIVIALAFGLLTTTLLAFWMEYIDRSRKVP